MNFFNIGDRIKAFIKSFKKTHSKLGLDGYFRLVARDKNGNILWTEFVGNLITNAGLDHSLESTLGAGTQITAWYLGLTDGTPTVAAGDTAASHAGWTEVTAYDEADRQACTFGATSAQSIDNVGNEAVFTISTNSTTIGGAFLISDDTKGGSTGTLFSAAAFTGGDRSLDDGDTLTVDYTCAASDA